MSNVQVGYIDGIGTPHITADILAAINQATQFLGGSVVWDDFEYKSDFSDPRVEVYGIDPSDNAVVVYPLKMQVINDEIWTDAQEAAMAIVCVLGTCCGKCGIKTGGDCYCKQVNCTGGTCDQRNYGWAGWLGDTTINYL